MGLVRKGGSGVWTVCSCGLHHCPVPGGSGIYVDEGGCTGGRRGVGDSCHRAWAACGFAGFFGIACWEGGWMDTGLEAGSQHDLDSLILLDKYGAQIRSSEWPRLVF